MCRINRKETVEKLEAARRRRERVVELTFKGSLTSEEFSELAELAKFRACPMCGFDFEAAKGKAGTEKKSYCSDGCLNKAERNNAPMIKSQPQTASVNIGTSKGVTMQEIIDTVETEETHEGTVEANDAALVHLTPQQYLMPAVSIDEAVTRQLYLQQVVQKLLVEAVNPKDFAGADYGRLPGTKDRSLFFNGAQKLAFFFGLRIEMTCTRQVEEWDNFFFYEYRATVVDPQGRRVMNIDRSCSTKESKYAWVWVRAVAPGDEETMFDMEADGSGMWRDVWSKPENGYVSVWHERHKNPDPNSLQMTVQAMAEKRAYVAIVEIVLAAQGFFSAPINFDEYPDALSRSSRRSEPKPERGNGKAATAKPSYDGDSPAEKALNLALFNHFIDPKKGKGEKAGTAYFEQVILKKSFDDRIRLAAELKLDSAPGNQSPVTEVIEEAPVVTEEVVKDGQPDDHFIAVAEVEEMIEAAKAAPYNQTDAQVQAFIKGKMSHNVLNDMTVADLLALKTAFSLWFKQIVSASKTVKK